MLAFLALYEQLWIAYPKKLAENILLQINRGLRMGRIWANMSLEGLGQIALDGRDESGLRFRKIEFIKKMTRSIQYKKQ